MLKSLIAILIIVVCSSPVLAAQRVKRQKSRMTPELAKMIVKSARRHGLDPMLLLEIARCETNFNYLAKSHAGAEGLMQFIPSTALQYGVENPYDPQQALDGACRYLLHLLKLFDGRLDLALAGYNAGEHRVIQCGYRVPRITETQNYVRSIMLGYLKARAIAERKREKEQSIAERRAQTEKQSTTRVQKRLILGKTNL